MKKHQEEDRTVPNHRDQGQTVQLEGIDETIKKFMKNEQYIYVIFR